MIISSMARIALVSVIFAAPALAQAPAGDAPKQDAPAKKSAFVSWVKRMVDSGKMVVGTRLPL
jgi:hypothetical protein